MKKRFSAILGSLLILGFVMPKAAIACSTFFVKNSTDAVVAKNLDWFTGQGLIFINKRNVHKKALPVDGQSSPEWTSKFVSFTVTQTGRDFPWDGFNEAGLSINAEMLAESAFPGKTDPRPAINALQWMQFILDTSDSIAAAIVNASMVRVSGSIQVHYFLCDSGSNCAVFEYLNGNLVIHRGASLPYAALTNDIYEVSLNYLANLLTFKTPGQILWDLSPDSLNRFTRAALFSSGYDSSQNSIEYAYKGLANLNDVYPTWRTYWSMAFALKRKMGFLTTLASPNLKSVNLRLFNPDCSSGTQILDINSPASGDVSSQFKRYTPEANQALINADSKVLNAEIKSVWGKYPEQYTRCMK